MSFQFKELKIRIETPFHKLPEGLPRQLQTRKTAPPFSRGGADSDTAGTVAPDRMFKRKVALPPQKSFKNAYDATIARNAAGLLHCRFPFKGKDMFVDVDRDTVRLGTDPATIKTKPLMTLGPDGKMTHSKKLTEQDCILMSGALWALQISTTSMLF